MSNPAVPFAAGAADGSTARPVTPSSTLHYTQMSDARRWVPVAVLTVVGVACLVAVIPMYRHGIAGHAFPSYVDGDPTYEVKRYTAPWIAGAIALAGLGVIFVMVAVARIVGTRGTVVTESRQDPVPTPVGGSPRPIELDPRANGLEPRPSEAAREY